jgi:hypothetical protein
MANNDYYTPLEYKIAAANSWYSYSLVDRVRKQLLTVKVDKKKRSIEEGYDYYY